MASPGGRHSPADVRVGDAQMLQALECSGASPCLWQSACRSPQAQSLQAFIGLQGALPCGSAAPNSSSQLSHLGRSQDVAVAAVPASESGGAQVQVQLLRLVIHQAMVLLCGRWQAPCQKLCSTDLPTALLLQVHLCSSVHWPCSDRSRTVCSMCCIEGRKGEMQ